MANTSSRPSLNHWLYGRLKHTLWQHEYKLKKSVPKPIYGPTRCTVTWSCIVTAHTSRPNVLRHFLNVSSWYRLRCYETPHRLHRRQIQVLGVLVKCVWCGAYYWFRLRKGTGYGFMHFWLACCYSCCLFSVRYRCIWGRCGRCGVSWHPIVSDWWHSTDTLVSSRYRHSHVSVSALYVSFTTLEHQSGNLIGAEFSIPTSDYDSIQC